MLEGKLGEVVRLVIREVRRAEMMLVKMLKLMFMLMLEDAVAGEEADADDLEADADAGGGGEEAEGEDGLVPRHLPRHHLGAHFHVDKTKQCSFRIVIY